MENREQLLALLRENARYSTDDLARLSDLDPETVAETMEALEADGVIGGYQAIVNWDAVESEQIHASVELNVTLDRETSYDEIARRIAKFPEVRSLRLMSGDFDFEMIVEGESMQDVADFVRERVAPVPEITQTVTHFVMETYKERGIEFDGEDDDDRLSVSP
jgi:DNA-binding Lrp family transcriptional regulator